MQDLARGTKLELPYWQVEGLRGPQARNYVTADLPKFYKEVYREIMSADPDVVDLQKMGPNYYEFGRHLIKLSEREGAELCVRGSSFDLDICRKSDWREYLRNFPGEVQVHTG